MTTEFVQGEAARFSPGTSPNDVRYAAWFHELDAWTEYWDIYHPETRGRYYFGNGQDESGLLTRFLPKTTYPAAFTTWTQLALGVGPRDSFVAAIRASSVAEAILEVDQLVATLFAKHFGDSLDPVTRADYLDGIFRFAIDCLPAAVERDARIPVGDWRKPTAGRHTLDGDLMWFAWALQLEAAQALAEDQNSPRRALMLAGITLGCPANFAWRGHRRTRPEYRPDAATASLLRGCALEWASNFSAAVSEVHALYRIREWGSDS